MRILFSSILLLCLSHIGFSQKDFKLLATNTKSNLVKELKPGSILVVKQSDGGKLRGKIIDVMDGSILMKEQTGLFKTNETDWDLDNIQSYSYRSNIPKYVMVAGAVVFLGGAITAANDNDGGIFPEGLGAAIIGTLIVTSGLVWEIGQSVNWKPVPKFQLATK